MFKTIPTKDNIKTITDLRDDPVSIMLDLKKRKGPLYIFYKSEPLGALIDIETFKKTVDIDESSNELQDAIENSDKKFIDFDELDRELRRKHGLSHTSRKKG